MVEPTTDSCRKNTRFSSAGGAVPLVAPAITIRAAGPQRAQRVRPGGLADGLHHRVDPLGQPAPAGKAWSAPSSSARASLASLRLVAHTR